MRQAIVNKTKKKHIGFGKVILFGEHFVVYGAKAIVAGVEEFTSCRLELIQGKPGFSVIDMRPAVPGYIIEKAEEQRKAYQLVFDHLKIDLSLDGLCIYLEGPLVPSSGIGASASDVVSLTRALNEMYNLKLTENEINLTAFIGEGGYHGTPSGVDNTAATFGGLILFQRMKGSSSLFSRILSVTPLYLIVCSSGITASTYKVVAEVRDKKLKNPIWFQSLMERYNKCVEEAIFCIHVGNIKRLGELMNENHTLCQELTVSCKELNSIVEFCCKHGALGAKMSGTGRGGLVIALALNENQRDYIANIVKENCPEAKFVWKYTVFPNNSKL